MKKKYFPPPYFSNWVDNFMPPIASFFLPFIEKIKFITPNHLTIISFILYIFASFLLLFDFTYKAFVISIIFFFSYIFDCLDGQLARKTKKTSLIGKFLDFNLDYLKVYFLFLFLSLTLYNQTNDYKFIFFSLSSAFFFGFRFYIKETIIFINMEKDKNYLIKSQKMREFLYQKIKKDRSEKKFFLDKLIDFLKINLHLLRIDEGELIFFTIIGLFFKKLDVIVIFVFLMQLFWIIFRLFQRSYQLLYKQKKLIEPILR